MNEEELAAIEHANVPDMAPLNIGADDETMSNVLIEAFDKAAKKAEDAIKAEFEFQHLRRRQGMRAADLYGKVGVMLGVEGPKLRAGQLAIIAHHFGVGFGFLLGVDIDFRLPVRDALNSHNMKAFDTSTSLRRVKDLAEVGRSAMKRYLPEKSCTYDVLMPAMTPLVTSVLTEEYSLYAHLDFDVEMCRNVMAACAVTHESTRLNVKAPVNVAVPVLIDMLCHVEPESGRDDGDAFIKVALRDDVLHFKVRCVYPSMAKEFMQVLNSITIEDGLGVGVHVTLISSADDPITYALKDPVVVDVIPVRSLALPTAPKLAEMTRSGALDRMKELIEEEETSKQWLVLLMTYLDRCVRKSYGSDLSNYQGAMIGLKAIRREIDRERESSIEEYDTTAVEWPIRVVMRTGSDSKVEKRNTFLKAVLEIIKSAPDKWAVEFLKNVGGYRREWLPGGAYLAIAKFASKQPKEVRALPEVDALIREGLE